MSPDTPLVFWLMLLSRTQKQLSRGWRPEDDPYHTICKELSMLRVMEVFSSIEEKMTMTKQSVLEQWLPNFTHETPSFYAIKLPSRIHKASSFLVPLVNLKVQRMGSIQKSQWWPWSSANAFSLISRCWVFAADFWDHHWLTQALSILTCPYV